MRALLLGAGGLLGQALADAVPGGVELVAADHAALDITDRRAVERTVEDLGPALILNAAAYTAVDLAESRPDRAYAVNAAAVATLGEIARNAGLRVVHVSTDYVFDGRGGAPYPEHAPPAPLGVYGETKLAGERALLGSGASALVVRSQWLYGSTAGFPVRMLARAQAGLATRVVADQRGRPTAAQDLAPALWRLALTGATGVLHLAGSGDATWFDVASVVFQHAGRASLVAPCSTAEFPTPAARPADSRLDCTRAESLLGGALPPWRESLSAILSQVHPART